jgi:hypothetical protein
MTARVRLEILILTIISFGLLWVLHDFSLPWNTLLWRAISNAGHVPLFGILSIAILRLSIRVLRRYITSRPWHYVVALISSAFLGLVSEYAQILGPRDADIIDLGRDIAGAVTFLGVLTFFDRELATWWQMRGSRVKSLLLVVAVLPGAIGVLPAGLWAAATWHRDNSFPALCTFDSAWDGWFWDTRDIHFVITDPPAGWKKPPDDRVALLTFLPGEYPSFTCVEPVPDWTGYRFLSFELYSTEDNPIDLTFKVEDMAHNECYDDRFNQIVVVKPGVNQVVIPLDSVRQAPVSREMDLTSIALFSLFAGRTEKPFVMYVDNFQLQ